MTAKADGVTFELRQPARECILAIADMGAAVRYHALGGEANSRDLALLKKACESYLELPLVQALSTEDLPDV